MKPLALIALLFSVSAFAAPPPADPLPPVYFNHVTIFLPPAAYAALRQSAFLRNELGSFEETTVKRDGGSWSYTGIFIFGQHTYLEMFEAGEDAHFGTTVPGQLVFNMWIDDRKQLPRFQDRLAATTGANLHIDTARNANNQPTYDKVVSKGSPAVDFGPGMRVDAQIKGYYPDGITREKRLENVFLAQRQLHDITGFTLMVNEAERNRLIQQFRAYSYDISVDGAKQVVSGPGITLTLVPAEPNVPRTLIIDLSMNRPMSEQTYKLEGGGEIGIQGSAGKWMFSFPHD